MLRKYAQLGEDEGRAVEEAAYALRCLVYPTREAFWGAALAPATPTATTSSSSGREGRLAECVRLYYGGEGDATSQRRALQQILSEVRSVTNYSPFAVSCDFSGLSVRHWRAFLALRTLP
jgi:hypothetical protein